MTKKKKSWISKEQVSAMFIGLQEEIRKNPDEYDGKRVALAMHNIMKQEGSFKLPVPLTQATCNVGLEIKLSSKLEDNINGYVIVDKDDKGPVAGIVVSTDIKPGKQRFTAAHELGHYMCEYDGNGKFYSNSTRGDHSPEELNANKFATEFLVPESEFITALNCLNGLSFNDKVCKLSKLFAVTLSCIERRFEELGIE